LLIAAGANVKSTTRIGAITPLSLAAKNGNPAMIEVLLKAGADANTATSTGATVLMSAALSGSADAVKVLINHGADVNAKENANGQTALMFAAWENRPEVIKVLVEHGADMRVSTKVIELNEPRVDDDGNIIPPRGAPRGDPAGGYGAGNAPGNAGAPAGNAAAAAAGGARGGGFGGRGGDDGPTGNSFMGGMTALLFAARDGHLEAVRALVEAGADVNQVSASEKSTPIVIAIANGHYTVGKYLLDHGADPNIANYDGLTPVYATVNMRYAPVSWAPNPVTDQEKVDSLDLLKALLDQGADPNVRVKRKLWFSPTSHDTGWVDFAGSTAFWRAAQSTDVESMKILAARGADPKLATNAGVTPLMVAAGIGWIGNFNQNAPDSWMAAVKYCLELGNDINAVESSKGYTALHGAASRGDSEMVQFLVEKGAKLGVADKEGRTPLTWAEGVFLATHPAKPKPSSIALIKELMGQP